MPDIEISASKLKSAKAAGPDSLKPVVLKELSHIIAPAVADIFQKSLAEGAVPSDWKRAQVCPFFQERQQIGTSKLPPNVTVTAQCHSSARQWNISLLPVLPNISTGKILYTTPAWFP